VRHRKLAQSAARRAETGADCRALTYYVRSLIGMRGTPEALALKAKLNASAPRAPEKTKGPRAVLILC
jgi:hypothetical protein